QNKRSLIASGPFALALALVAHNLGAATGGGGGAAAGGGGRRILQVLSYRHGLRSVPGGEECGRGRQLDGSSAGPAGVRQRDAVDPLPVGGVRGQRVGVLQRGDWSRIHVLLSVVHSAVSNHTVFARDVRVTTFLLTRSTRSLICRQVYEAYRNGKVEEAMSFGFLFFLFSGDLTSFAGCYLTSQLPIQLVTVVFYIFTDLILISQFLYYKIKNSSSRKSIYLKLGRSHWLCMWVPGIYILPQLPFPPAL
uniref:Solute carrier family 66 member 3 n=1 Tax=Gasterosteus aculeatus aculeatus TaxID=481459 RepID=A0AAQ4R4U4_GASAC